jgi:neutral trehalase
LCAYLEWDLRNRDADGGGLLEWQIDENPLCRSGESGMDNSPRFDAATRLDAVDFNSFFSLECQVMAGFAHGLGLADDAAKWMNRHMEMNRLIAARLWSDEIGFFVDYDTERRALSSVLASSGFLALICGAASREQAARLAECLADPTMFGTAFPVPSIAAQDTQHYSKDMWRGPVWINLNWLIMRGFDRYGMKDVVAALRTRTMKGIEAGFGRYGVLFEFFDDRGEVEPPKLLRKGQCAPEKSPLHQVFHDYGWTATLYADMAYQNAEIAH